MKGGAGESGVAGLHDLVAFSSLRRFSSADEKDQVGFRLRVCSLLLQCVIQRGDSDGIRPGDDEIRISVVIDRSFDFIDQPPRFIKFRYSPAPS